MTAVPAASVVACGWIGRPTAESSVSSPASASAVGSQSPSQSSVSASHGIAANVRARNRVSLLAALVNWQLASPPLRRRVFFGAGAVWVSALTACRNNCRSTPPIPAFGCCLLPRTVSRTVRVLSLSPELLVALSLPGARVFLFLALRFRAGSGTRHLHGLGEPCIAFAPGLGLDLLFFGATHHSLGLIRRGRRRRREKIGRKIERRTDCFIHHITENTLRLLYIRLCHAPVGSPPARARYHRRVPSAPASILHEMRQGQSVPSRIPHALR